MRCGSVSDSGLFEKDEVTMISIPGLEHLEKEGWELVSFRRVVEGESYIDRHGKVKQWQTETESESSYLVVRKVVKPDEYRPFENAAEYIPHFDRTLITMDRPGAVRVVECNDNGVWIGPGSAMLTYAQVLSDGFRFGDNGTPFGVKVQS